MQRLTHREAPPANLLISGARLFDGGSGLEGVQLDVRVVEGRHRRDRLATWRPTGPRRSTPPG